jgi:hypothetical protein
MWGLGLVHLYGCLIERCHLFSVCMFILAPPLCFLCFLRFLRFLWSLLWTGVVHVSRCLAFVFVLDANMDSLFDVAFTEDCEGVLSWYVPHITCDSVGCWFLFVCMYMCQL